MSRYVPPQLYESVRPGRVAKVMEWGFTQRQARFLTHVLVFSGVFLERQYRAFAGIAHGQKTHDFLAKLVEGGTPRRSRPARCTAAGCTTSNTNRCTRRLESRTIETGSQPRSVDSSSD